MKLVTIREAAEQLAMKQNTLYAWSSRGILQRYKVKIGRSVRIDIVQLLEDIKTGVFESTKTKDIAESIFHDYNHS